MLLKMTFVFKPQIKIVSFGQTNQFFYIAPVAPDLLGRSRAWACVSGSPTDETASGTDVPPGSPAGSAGGDGTRVFHPRDSGNTRSYREILADPGPRPEPAAGSDAEDGRISLGPAGR